TAPLIESRPEGDEIVVVITDERSPLIRLEYSIDAREWRSLIPVDGIADSSRETVRLKRSEIAGRFVIVRAMDAHFNVATASIPSP
ncbi:MAG TPA: hypothetical protein VM534_10385, partial [Thermoanaerobaculia bacterium]|nr:hypothetical protein [Thermoanaerobaculia bacterium]